MNKILACVDRSHFAEHIADHATWAAARLETPLELLHVIDRQRELATSADQSGAIGLDAKEALLSTLTADDEARGKAAREEGRAWLNGLRERAVSRGFPAPDIRQRYGEVAQTLEELEAEVRLFVVGRRGESSQTTQRELGRNVERIARALHRPILAVTDTFHEPQRVMIAFDGGVTTRKAVERIAVSPLLRGLSIHLLMSGAARGDSAKLFGWASDKLQSAGFETTSGHIPGDAEQVIAQQISALHIDLLVIGAYAHSALHGWIWGSRTSALLRSTNIPTLLMR